MKEFRFYSPETARKVTEIGKEYLKQMKQQMKERQKDIRRVEYYLNEKLYKDVPYSKYGETDEQIKSTLLKNKYVHNYSSEYMNRLPDTWEVYVLPEKYKVVVISHKIFTGHYDRKGNKIYEGDRVKTPYGFEASVHGHYDGPNHYYVRQYGPRDCDWTDYDIDDWSQYEKVKDVNKTPKKFWKNPETTDKSIIK